MQFTLEMIFCRFSFLKNVGNLYSSCFSLSLFLSTMSLCNNSGKWSKDERESDCASGASWSEIFIHLLVSKAFLQRLQTVDGWSVSRLSNRRLLTIRNGRFRVILSPSGEIIMRPKLHAIHLHLWKASLYPHFFLSLESIQTSAILKFWKSLSCSNSKRSAAISEIFSLTLANETHTHKRKLPLYVHCIFWISLVVL